MPADFVHLRTHSAYSLSEGAIKADKIAALAADAAMPAAAITDSGNLFGALEFSQACLARGVQPIIGCQIPLSRPGAPRAAPDKIVVLARDAQGLAAIKRLSSAVYLDSDPQLPPQLSFARLADASAGLILLTGGSTGPLHRLLVEQQQRDATVLLSEFAEVFSGRLAVELHRHGQPVTAAIEPGLLALAQAAALPLVATNDCLFPTPRYHRAHDVLLCIADQRQVQEADRRRATPEHWFKPATAMRALFADLPDACDNTLAIARACSVFEEARKPLLPRFPRAEPGCTAAQTLRAVAQAGLAARLDTIAADPVQRASYAARLEYELAVIAA
ncbi:MAG: PHP domain-containing protein, partial [Acidocella sp.]|nr:PHP domain-containing protein [Acidocella sp.]